MKKYTLLFIFLSALQILFSQNKCNGWVEISMSNKITSAKISGYEVFIEKSHQKFIADSSGIVRIQYLCDSSMELEISYLDTHIHLISAINTKLKLTYHPPKNTELIRLKTLLLVTSTTHNSDVQYLSAEKLSQLTQQDFSKQLANIPMMHLISTGQTISKPMYQGMSGLRLPLFVNSTRLEGQAWGNDHAPEVGGWGGEFISVLKGVEAQKLASDAWGSAVLISHQPKYHPFGNDFSSILEYQSNNQSIRGGAKLVWGSKRAGDGSYFLISALKGSDYYTPFGYLSNTAANELSLYGGHTYSTKSNTFMVDYSYYRFQSGIYLGSHIGNTSDLLTAIKSNAPALSSNNYSYTIGKPYQLGTQQMISIRKIPKSNKGIELTLNYQRNQRKEFDPHRNSQLTFPQLNVWLQTVQFKIANNEHHGKPWSWGSSIQAQFQDFGGYFFVPAFKSYYFNAYGLYDLKSLFKSQFTDHKIVIRTDYLYRETTLQKNIPHNQSYSGFSGGYSVGINRKSHFYQFHFSQSWRAPSVNELFSEGVHHGSASYELGNKGLRPETGQKIEFSINSKAGKWLWHSSAFLQYSQNYIHLNPLPEPVVTVRGAFPAYKHEQLPTIIGGISWWSEAKLSIGTLILRGDFLYSRILNPSRYATQLPPIQLSTQYTKEIKSFKFNLQYAYTFKQFLYTPNTDFSAPPEGYHLISGEISTRFKNKAFNSRLSLFGNNLLNVVYRNYLDRFRYFTPMPGRNIGLKLLIDIHHHRTH